MREGTRKLIAISELGAKVTLSATLSMLAVAGKVIGFAKRRTVGLRRQANELRSSWRRARDRGVVWTGEDDP